MSTAFDTQSALPLPDALERLARRRAAQRMGWIGHATVFTVVQLLLAALAWRSGHAWNVWPLLGWGVGLVLHGAAVWGAAPGGRVHQHLLAAERARLRREPGNAGL